MELAAKIPSQRMLIPCLCQDGFHGQIWREQNTPVTKEIQHHLWDGKLTSAKENSAPTSKMAGLASMKNAPSIILAGGRGDVGSNILPRTESGSEVRVVLVVLNRRPPTFRVTTSPSLIAILFNSLDFGSKVFHGAPTLSEWAVTFLTATDESESENGFIPSHGEGSLYFILSQISQLGRNRQTIKFQHKYCKVMSQLYLVSKFSNYYWWQAKRSRLWSILLWLLLCKKSPKYKKVHSKIMVSLFLPTSS